MTGSIDLHTHSTASDGTFSPSQLVEMAVKQNLSVIALTDHDTVEGIPEFLQAAHKTPALTVVPGVEFSVSFQNTEVHIIGLFIDHTLPSLISLLERVRRNRQDRNLKMIQKLRSLGYEITYDEVISVAGNDENIGRPHFARILIQKGYFKSIQEVFDSCLKRGARAYCERVLPFPRQAIDEIHKAGGFAIWAHPVYRRDNERAYVRKTIKRLIKMGIDGLEAYYTSFSSEQKELMLSTAAENNLLISGGSDFHGLNQPAISLGTGFGNLAVPYSVYENFIKRLELAKTEALA